MIGKLMSFIVLASLCVVRTLHGADGNAQQRHLMDGAKKEGKLVFYRSVETEFARSLTSGFETKYPFIKTDIFRSTHEKILSRMNVERKTGTYTADVVSVGNSKPITCKRGASLRPISRPLPPPIPKDSKIPMVIGPIFTTT